MRLAQALENARVPYAIGGAIALSYYGAPRGTEDIDVNVFRRAEDAQACLAALRRLGISCPEAAQIQGDQLALSWEHTPIHLFFSYDPFHEACRERARRVPFADGEIQVLSAEDIAIFKAVYDRPKDRAEIREVLLCLGEQMDIAYTLTWLTRLLGAHDQRVSWFRAEARALVPASGNTP